MSWLTELLWPCDHSDEVIDKTTRPVVRCAEHGEYWGWCQFYETKEVVLVLQCKKCGRLKTIVE